MPSMVRPTACDLHHSTVAWGMRIHDILRRKGDSVITIGSDASLGELLALLTEHRIGAVVVSDADGEVTGIVSERDVITRLHATGLATENLYVRDLMTSPRSEERRVGKEWRGRRS